VEPTSAKPHNESSVAKPFVSALPRHLLALIVAILCFLADVTTKLWASLSLPLNQSKPFLPPFLQLTLVTNTGAAFSLGEHNAQLVLIVSTMVFCLLVLGSLRRYQHNRHPLLEELGMAIVLGSALGNLADRYLHGGVTDFLEFTFVSFPVFNVADVLIDVGIGLIIISTFSKKRGDAQGEADSEHE
jgi:signal peptidase II